MKVDESLRQQRLAQWCEGHDRVLDIGCADMPNRYLMNKTVIGLDLVRPSVIPENYEQWIVADATAIGSDIADEPFDVVIAGEVIEHLEKPIDALRAWKMQLRPGGLLLLSTPNPNSLIERLLTINLCSRWYYTKDHIMLFPQRWLIRMLEVAGFESIKLRSGGFPVPGIGLVPFPRPWCYQTLAAARKPIGK